MATRRLTARGGLATDPSSINSPEALRQANNVSLHRPGIIMPRLGFGDLTGIGARTSDYRPFQAIRFRDDVVVASADLGGASDYKLERLSTNAPYTSGDPAPPVVDRPDTRPLFPYFLARGSLYIVTNTEGTKGIRKILAPDESVTARAGLATTYCPPAPNLIAATAGDDRVAIGSGKCAAYRIVLYRKDVNGYEIRSAPSSRDIVRAPAGTYANGIRVDLANLAGLAYKLATTTIGGPDTDDVIEVYRTRNVSPDTADPGEEYYLAFTHVITSGEVSAGQVTSLLDDVQDEQLGVALYTNPSQLGAVASKEVPPMGNDGAYWRECAWIGGTQDRATLQLYLTKVVRMAGPALEGIGVVGDIAGTADATLNSPTLANVSLSAAEWDCVAIGQWISGPNGPGTSASGIPGTARVLSFDEGAQTITMTVNATATNVGITIKAGDLMSICGTEYFFYTTESQALRWFEVSQATDLATRVYNTAQCMARVIGGSAARGDGRAFSPRDDQAVGGSGDLLLLSVRPEGVDGADTITVQCTMRGGAFTPNITSEVESPDPYVPGRLAWSAQNEPEAWPPLQNTIIGNALEPIQRLIALDDALLVWKTDGVYKVTGYPPNSWVVDLISSDLRLFSAESVCEHRGRCYAWTNQGIIEIASTGAWRLISGPIDDVIRFTEVVFSEDHAGRAWQVVSDDRLNRVFFGRDVEGDEDIVAIWLVWHPGTERWSEYDMPSYGLSYDQGVGKLLRFDTIEAWNAAYERSNENDPFSFYDIALTSLTASAEETTVTIAVSELDGYVPDVGDVLYRAATQESRRITAVSEDAGDYTITIDSAFENEVALLSWFQAINVELMWQAQELPGAGCRWGEHHFRFGELESAYTTTIVASQGGQTERNSTPTTQSVSITALAAERAGVVRIGPPRNTVRAARLYPYLAVRHAGARWTLESLDLHHTETGRRVAR